MVRLATQAEVSNPKRKGYDFRIDDFLFRAAIGPNRQMTIQSSDVQTQDLNVSQNPEDFTRNLGRIYSRNDFSGGSNLDMAHKRGMSELDASRFWDSSGVDVFTKNKGTPYSLKLLSYDILISFLRHLTWVSLAQVDYQKTVQNLNRKTLFLNLVLEGRYNTVLILRL